MHAPSQGIDVESQFREIYESLYGRVHADARRRLGSEAADEIAAETFLVPWRRFETVPREPLPWLYGVARNMVLRHRGAHARQEEARRALTIERPVRELAESDDPEPWDAWEQLSDADREVLALAAWEELPVAEAARCLGCSAPVFSVRLHRARKRLERLLAHRRGRITSTSRIVGGVMTGQLPPSLERLARSNPAQADDHLGQSAAAADDHLGQSAAAQAGLRVILAGQPSGGASSGPATQPAGAGPSSGGTAAGRRGGASRDRSVRLVP